jgi:hypothetical protein
MELVKIRTASFFPPYGDYLVPGKSWRRTKKNGFEMFRAKIFPPL